MKIDLKFAELHTPLFHAGTNLGQKLDIKKRPIKLIYDRTEKELIIFFNNEVTILPHGNVAAMTPIDSTMFIKEYGFKDIVKELEKPVHIAPVSITSAQIEVPMQKPRGRPATVKTTAQVSHPVEDVVFGGPKV